MVCLKWLAALCLSSLSASTVYGVDSFQSRSEEAPALGPVYGPEITPRGGASANDLTDRAIQIEQIATTGVKEKLEASNQSLAHRPYLTGDWNGYRTKLADQGILPYFGYAFDFMDNVHGGKRTGGEWGSLLTFGLDLEFEKLADWKGGYFHIGFNYYEGRSVNDHRIGARNGASDLSTGSQFKMADAYFLQEFKDGQYSIKFGQMSPDSDFMLSDYRGLFFNGAFGTIRTLDNFLSPQYSMAGVGVVGYAEPITNYFVQGGLFFGDSGKERHANHGFNYRFGGDRGYLFLYEAGSYYKILDRKGSVKVGGLYDTGVFKRFIDGSNKDNGIYSFYITADQELITNAQGETILGGTLRAGISPQTSVSQVNYHLEGVINWFGPLPCRPKDVFGLGLAYVHFGNDYVKSQRDAGTNISTGETVLEMTYAVSVTPWLTVQPDFQIIFNPMESRKNAYVVGLEAKLVF